MRCGAEHEGACAAIACSGPEARGGCNRNSHLGPVILQTLCLNPGRKPYMWPAVLASSDQAKRAASGVWSHCNVQ